MNTVTIWIVILGGMLITYFLRSSFLLFLGKESIPIWLFRCLRYTPVVVLSALIVPLLVKNGDVVQVNIQNPKIIAGAIALIVSVKTRNTFLTLTVGMGTLLILAFIIGKM